MKKLSAKTALLVIDVQERFIPTINRVDEMSLNILKCIEAAKLFSMPLLYSEQYPQGLGSTVEDLRCELGDAKRFEKSTFSCFGEADFCDYLQQEKIESLLIVGIEAHVCVYQTALDALERGLEVFIAADAVSSRKEFDAQVALQDLSSQGAQLSTFEMLFLQLLGSSKHPLFKGMSNILKKSM